MDKSKLAVDTYDKIAEVYTKTYFEDFSDFKYLDKFLKFLPKGAHILDVGCGPGQFSKYMAKRGFRVTGIDFSDGMLKIAGKKVLEAEFQKMDMRKLVYPENTFDALLVSYSLIHIPSNQIPDTVKGFYKVLKPGGYLEVIAQKGKANQIVDEPFMPSEKMFFNFFNHDKLVKFFKNAGFEIISFDEAPSPDPEFQATDILYMIVRKP